MTHEEITKLNREVRVIGSTGNGGKLKEMIGKEYQVDTIYFGDNTVMIKGWCFNLSDVQFLTHLSFKNRRIAIGDEVQCRGGGNKWYKVYGYRWQDGRYLISLVKDNDFENSCFSSSQSEITAHRTPLDKPSLSGKEVDVVVDGISYKAIIK